MFKDILKELEAAKTDKEKSAILENLYFQGFEEGRAEGYDIGYADGYEAVTEEE